MAETDLSPLAREYLPLYVAAFWLCIVVFVAFVSGWRNLAMEYRAPGPFSGQRWRFQSAGLRWGTSYGNCLTVGASPDGLYLAVMILFRPGHPPLFIPWQEISAVERRRFYFFSFVELRARKVPTVPIILRRSLVAKLAPAAGPACPLAASTRLAVPAGS